MNNLYSWFTHAQNIQDGCWFGPRYTTAKHDSAIVPSADSSRINLLKLRKPSSVSSAARVAPASCGILAAGCSDAQTWTDQGCRTSREEEEPAPSAYRQHAVGSARTMTPAKLSRNNWRVRDEEGDLIAHVKTELRSG